MQAPELPGPATALSPLSLTSRAAAVRLNFQAVQGGMHKLRAFSPFAQQPVLSFLSPKGMCAVDCAHPLPDASAKHAL